jgi:hypothetical protein
MAFLPIRKAIPDQKTIPGLLASHLTPPCQGIGGPIGAEAHESSSTVGVVHFAAHKKNGGV